MAELIDNAYDPDVEASELHIDIRKINGKDCLTVTDNGNGMDVDHLEKMLSLGFCEKEQYEKAEGPRARKPIGRFGNGFKSGSMRLAKDALVFTVSEESETGSIGFLSQTLCKEHNYDTLILPIMEYQFQDQDHILSLGM
ncbi:hypothetical protein V1264_021847 [Littorina saxatilis]|uniref:Uncharacterized protein n=1 Tax=Littorina saxatilis TaxID=31220 RepID=A0AAN9AJ37_9CAEN